MEARNLKQLDLLTRPPASRSTDPLSSHLAEEGINRDGTRASQQHAVLQAVLRWPGCTSRELAEKAGMDRYMVARRLPELEPGYVKKGDLRPCRHTRKKCLTWWPK